MRNLVGWDEVDATAGSGVRVGQTDGHNATDELGARADGSDGTDALDVEADRTDA